MHISDGERTAECRLGAGMVVLLSQGTPKTHMCDVGAWLQLDRPAEESLGLCEGTAAAQQQLFKLTLLCGSPSMAVRHTTFASLTCRS
jgi:hypothetical protein